MLIDEIEKAGTRSDYGRFWDCLLGFLEPETNSRYPDPALQTKLDLSHISYVATANSLGPITLTDPRSLPRRFPFRSQTHHDLDALLPAVIADLAQERGLHKDWVPPLDGVERAAVAQHWRGGSLRRLRRIVEAVLRTRDVEASRDDSWITKWMRCRTQCGRADRHGRAPRLAAASPSRGTITEILSRFDPLGVIDQRPNRMMPPSVIMATESGTFIILTTSAEQREVSADLLS